MKCTHILSSIVKLSYQTFNPVKSTHSSIEHPLVIIHGLFGSKRNWESIAKAFSRAGHKIITVDARNHGDSPHSDEMDYHSMSADVIQLLTDLGLSRVNILGHSMGGKIAMTLALTQPDLVENLIVEDIAPSTSLSLGLSESVAAMKSVKFEDKTLTSIAHARKLASHQLLAAFPDTPTRDFILTNIVQKAHHFGWRINLEAIGRGLENIIGFPQFDLSFNGKCLFVGGTRSQQISKPVYPEINRLFPQASIKHIEGAGHWVHSEKPHQFMAVVESFLVSPPSNP